MAGFNGQLFGQGGQLADNRGFRNGPVPVPAAPLPPGLGDADLSAIVGSWTDYHVAGTQATRQLQTVGKEIATIEVSPGSLWDAIGVQPANGPEIVLSPGMRYPVGRWKGPITVRPDHGRPRFPILSTAAFGTWVVSANTYSPQISVGTALFIAPKVELVAYPSRELADAQPMATRRAPLAFQATVNGSDVPASTFIAALVAHYGRVSASITLATTSGETFTGQIWGYRGSAAPTVVWPILPATDFSVSAAAALTVEIDGEWDYLAVAGSWDAGSGADLIVNWSAKDA